MEQMPSSKDRPAEQPGGVECEICGVIFIGAEWHTQCGVCLAEVERLKDTESQ